MKEEVIPTHQAVTKKGQFPIMYFLSKGMKHTCLERSYFKVHMHSIKLQTEYACSFREKGEQISIIKIIRNSKSLALNNVFKHIY